MTPLEIVRKIRAIKVRNVCVNCGYEEGVHHYETLQCPGDDPNSMKGGRLWRGTTYQTRPVPLLSANDAIRLIQSALDAKAKECADRAVEWLANNRAELWSAENLRSAILGKEGE